MPSFLGGYARATLKAAVINAENRNRLTEEDKCWREKNEKDSSNIYIYARKKHSLQFVLLSS